MVGSEVEARLAIDLTHRRYVEAVDSGEVDAFAALFAEDGAFIAHGLPERRGREAIRAFLFASREARTVAGRLLPIRHHVAPALVRLATADRAAATSYFTAMNAVGPDHWGVYRDELARIDGSWLFVRRAVVIEGADPDGWIGSGAGVVKFSPAR